MDIATQLKTMLGNQQQIMENQVVLLEADKAEWGPKEDKHPISKKMIEGYEGLIGDTNNKIKLTKQIRMAL